MFVSITTVASTFLLATSVLAFEAGAGVRQGHALAPQKHARAARAVSGVLSKKAKEAAAASDVASIEKKDEGEIEKRAEGSNGARMTYYDTSVGLGACGLYHAPSEYTVALNSAQLSQYGGNYPSPACGKMITISYNGKTTSASIQDECPTCPYGGLDLSQGLFEFFASTDVGVFYADWWYGAGAPKADPPKPKPQPTTTWTPEPEPTTTWKPKPTTTWTPPAPTTTWTPDPTTPTSTYTPPTTTWTPPTSTSSVYTPPTTSSTSTSEWGPSTSSAIPTTSSSAASSSSSIPSSSSASSASSSSAASSSATSSSSTGGDDESSASGSSTSGNGAQATTGPNNLANIASLTNMFGQVVCAGNPSCA